MTGRIPDADLAEVRERNRIDEVASEYVALRRAGADSLKGLCPFHDEKTPSFTVSPSRGLFHCFGCDEGGSVLDFVMKIEHLGFVEAVERLADRVGFTLTREGDSARHRERDARSRLVDANRLAQVFYAEQLSSADARPAREFLSRRGFRPDTVAMFGCGFSPGGWDRLARHLLGRGFTTDELLAVGLVRRTQRGLVDYFHRRLMWPIRDIGGDVVGFGARRLFDDDRSKAKYLNTAETPLYRKSQVLFGLDLAKREIVRQRQVIVVEGYTDVMAMHLAGVSHVVASCGTALGAEHIRALRRLLVATDDSAGEIVLVFDGDGAGRKAALRVFHGDQQSLTRTLVALAPDRMDPCELRRLKGDDAVRELVQNREPLVAFAVRSLLAGHDLNTPDGQVNALRQAGPLVASVKDPLLRDRYAVLLASQCGVDSSRVIRRVRELAGQNGHGQRQARSTADRVTTAPQGIGEQVQRELLKVALQQPSTLPSGYHSLPAEVFTEPSYAEVHAAILAVGEVPTSDSSRVDAVAARCPRRSLVTELAMEPLRGTPVQALLAYIQAAVTGRHVGEMKTQLRLTDPDLVGDLIAMEQHYRTLREQATGAI